MITVVGAGPGGLIAAADLSRAGHAVALVNRPGVSLNAVRTRGAVLVREAGAEWEGPLHAVGGDILDHASESTVFVFVLPAAAREGYLRQLLPVLRQGQKVLLMPGGTGGAFRAGRALFESGRKHICVLETDTLPYVARLEAPGTVNLFGRVPRILCSAFAAAQWPDAVGEVQRLFPALREADTVLHTSLMNFNGVLHPAAMLLNAGRVESGTSFFFYREGFTPIVARIAEAVDQERVTILRAYGLPAVSFAEHFFWAGYGPPPEPTGSLAAVLQGSAPNAAVLAPRTLAHRFILEDVPYGLVPMIALGAAARLPCSLMRAIVRLAEEGVGAAVRPGDADPRHLFGADTPEEIMRIARYGWGHDAPRTGGAG